MRVLTLVVLLLLACACGPPAPDTSEGAAGPVAVVTLATPEPGAATVVAPEVIVAKQAVQVQIRLAGFDRPADELTAELEAVETGEIRRWPVDAASGGGAMTVTVPAYAVGAGAHVLTIWAGDADLLRRYAFQVVVP